MPMRYAIVTLHDEINRLFVEEQSIMDCRNINFSQVKSEKRINKAVGLLGAKVVERIIGFALFFLGAAHKDINRLLNTPYETFNSFTKRMWKDGIVAFEDRRFSYNPEPITPEPILDMPTAKIQGDEVIIHLPCKTGEGIRMSTENKVVVKAVLLTLVQNQMLDSKIVADILGYTQSHTLYLSREVEAGSTEILFDGRRGQKQDYVFKPKVKAELIQQYSVNAIAGKSVASDALAIDLKERCGLDLSARSIRHHIGILGLKNIAKTLPKIFKQLKKKSGK